jgi:ABC-type multidrug transport system ATPase subunit
MEEVVTIHHEVKEIELISPSFPSTVDQTDAFVCWDKAKWSHNEEQRVHNAVERRKTYNRLRSLVWKDISLSVQVNEKSKKLLQKVSGSIQTGEMLAIMGPSGSGKTTLLKLLSGGWRTVSRNPAKERQFSGIIKVDGVTNPKLKTQKQIASVAQIEELPAGLTLYQNLRITALLNRPTNRRTKEEQLKFLDEIIDILELTDSKNTPCAVLSGGQQRRVSVAVQLLAESSLLLCDEPTSGLDSQIASKLLHTFRNLADRKGMGIVCSIHQPSAVLFNLFDKVLVLSEGRPVYYGHTSKVFDYCNRISMQYPSGWNASDVLLSVLCDTPSPLTEKSIAINEVTTSLLSTILNIENEYWSENLVKEGAGGSLSSIYEENDKHIGW